MEASRKTSNKGLRKWVPVGLVVGAILVVGLSWLSQRVSWMPDVGVGMDVLWAVLFVVAVAAVAGAPKQWRKAGWSTGRIVGRAILIVISLVVVTTVVYVLGERSL